MSATTLLTQSGLQVDLFPGKGPTVATFTALGNRDLEGTGFSGDSLIANGHAVLAFKTTRNDWWQSLPISEVEAIERAMGPVSMTYGSSAGGYAALLFARALRAERALALSPQFDIREPWDVRWSRHASRVVWRHAFDVLPPRATIFYDPFDIDARQVAHIVRAGPDTRWTLARVPWSGHPVGHVLQEAGVLAEVVAATLRDNVPASMRSWRHRVRRTRHRSAAYWHALAFAAIERGRCTVGEKLIRRALALAPGQPDMLNVLALAIAKQRDHAVTATPLQAASQTPAELQ